MSITGSMINWALWALIVAAVTLGWAVLCFVGLALPAIIRTIVDRLAERRLAREAEAYLREPLGRCATCGRLACSWCRQIHCESSVCRGR